MRTLFAIAALALISACGAPSAGTPEVAAPVEAAEEATTRFFTNEAGVAIGGYDPVQYFVDGAAVEGDPALTSNHEGARFHFANAENKAKFDADPAAYAPQYGGYCAFGMSRGYKAPTEADTGQVIDGKLYLNYNDDVRKTFDKDQQGYIGKANSNWETVKDAPAT